MDDIDESQFGPLATCRSCGGTVDPDDCLPLPEGGVLCSFCADDLAVAHVRPSSSR